MSDVGDFFQETLWDPIGDLWGGLTGQTAMEAGEISAQGSRDAAAVQERMFQQTRKDLLPYLYSGREGLYGLHELMGMPYYRAGTTVDENGNIIDTGLDRVTPSGDSTAYLRERPGYKFRLKEGLRALSRSAGAKGGFGGRNLRDMMTWGQDYASNEFNNEYNRLASMAGVGQSTGTTLGGYGMQSAANQGQAIQNAADARASGYLGSSNAIMNTVGTGLGLWGMAGFPGIGGGPQMAFSPGGAGAYGGM